MADELHGEGPEPARDDQAEQTGPGENPVDRGQGDESGEAAQLRRDPLRSGEAEAERADQPEGLPPSGSPDGDESTEGFEPWGDPFPGVSSIPPGVPGEIAGYEVGRRLGGGGFGQVYEGFQSGSNGKVAIKLSQLAPGSRDNHLEKEAEALAQLNHRLIPGIRTAGVDGPWAYLITEIIPGQNLASWRDGLDTPSFRFDLDTGEDLPEMAQEESSALKPDQIPTVMKWMKRLARALDHVHEAGLLHRDIKPANIMLTDDDLPVLVDFGLAIDSSEAQLPQVSGTPPFMAPEQASGAGIPLTAKSDLYSLGSTFFALITGVLPSRGATGVAMRSQISFGTVDPISRHLPRRDRGLDKIFASVLQREPQKRLGSGKELAERIDRWLESSTNASGFGQGMRIATAASAAAAVVLTVILIVWGGEPEPRPRPVPKPELTSAERIENLRTEVRELLLKADGAPSVRERAVFFDQALESCLDELELIRSLPDADLLMAEVASASRSTRLALLLPHVRSGLHGPGSDASIAQRTPFLERNIEALRSLGLHRATPVFVLELAIGHFRCGENARAWAVVSEAVAFDLDAGRKPGPLLLEFHALLGDLGVGRASATPLEMNAILVAMRTARAARGEPSAEALAAEAAAAVGPGERVAFLKRAGRVLAEEEAAIRELKERRKGEAASWDRAKKTAVARAKSLVPEIVEASDRDAWSLIRAWRDYSRAQLALLQLDDKSTRADLAKARDAMEQASTAATQATLHEREAAQVAGLIRASAAFDLGSYEKAAGEMSALLSARLRPRDDASLAALIQIRAVAMACLIEREGDRWHLATVEALDELWKCMQPVNARAARALGPRFREEVSQRLKNDHGMSPAAHLMAPAEYEELLRAHVEHSRQANLIMAIVRNAPARALRVLLAPQAVRSGGSWCGMRPHAVALTRFVRLLPGWLESGTALVPDELARSRQAIGEKLCALLEMWLEVEDWDRVAGEPLLEDVGARRPAQVLSSISAVLRYLHRAEAPAPDAPGVLAAAVIEDPENRLTPALRKALALALARVCNRARDSRDESQSEYWAISSAWIARWAPRSMLEESGRDLRWVEEQLPFWLIRSVSPQHHQIASQYLASFTDAAGIELVMRGP